MASSEALAIFNAVRTALAARPSAVSWANRNRALLLQTIDDALNEDDGEDGEDDGEPEPDTGDDDDLPPEEAPRGTFRGQVSVVPFSSSLNMPPPPPDATSEISFYVPTASVPKVYEMAREHGVVVRDFVPDRDRIGVRVHLALFGRDRTVPLTLSEQALYDETVDTYLAEWRRVDVTAPASEWTIIGTATTDVAGSAANERALVTNVTKPGYWTPEKIERLDFGRCDICQKYRHRTSLYVVTHKRDGRTYHVGGSCADHLDLGVKFRTLVKGVTQLIAELRKQEWMEDDEGLARWVANRVPTKVVLSFLDAFIAVHGYLSGAKAEEQFTVPTSQRAARWWDDHEGKHGLFYADTPRSAWLVERAQEVVAEKFKAGGAGTEFAQTLRAAMVRGPEIRGGWGSLAWLVSDVRRRSEEQVSTDGTAVKMWDPGETRTDVVLSTADLRERLARAGTTAAHFADLVGLSPKFRERAATGGDVLKGDHAKIAKTPIGQWDVINRRDIPGDFGVSTFMLLRRRDDGAHMTLSSSKAPSEITAGQTLRFGTVAVKDTANLYFRGRPQGPMINRATFEVVPLDELVARPAGAASNVPPIPPELLAAVRR